MLTAYFAHDLYVSVAFAMCRHSFAGKLLLLLKTAVTGCSGPANVFAQRVYLLSVHE